MRPRYRNVAFLIELMINILVFSLSCAILVGLFGRAWQISNRTNNETGAKTEVNSLVEVLRARGPQGLPEAALAEGEDENVHTLTLYYDADWQAIAPAEGAAGYAYRVELLVEDKPGEAGTLQAVSAAAHSFAGEALYALETAFYTPVF